MTQRQRSQVHDFHLRPGSHGVTVGDAASHSWDPQNTKNGHLREGQVGWSNSHLLKNGEK